MAIGLTDNDPIVRFDQLMCPVSHAVAAAGWPGRSFFLSPAAFDPPPLAQRVFATSQQLRVLSDFAQQIRVPSPGFGGFCDSFLSI